MDTIASALPDLAGVPLAQLADEARDSAARRVLPDLPPAPAGPGFSSSV